MFPEIKSDNPFFHNNWNFALPIKDDRINSGTSYSLPAHSVTQAPQHLQACGGWAFLKARMIALYMLSPSPCQILAFLSHKHQPLNLLTQEQRALRCSSLQAGNHICLPHLLQFVLELMCVYPKMGCEDCFCPPTVQKRVKTHRSLNYVYNGLCGDHCATLCSSESVTQTLWGCSQWGNYTAGKSALGKRAGKAQRPGTRTRGEDGSWRLWRGKEPRVLWQRHNGLSCLFLEQSPMVIWKHTINA